ncbi:unnamed protein product [Spirodela intermedia]|uniref:Uncharacterized protein n=1 Tax=Spirodela intermedia TaxID=51605 RepID=A0A7I8IBD7_SPIIN|nr:unnamed protein product [Spirodela intermedia]CAA6654898.1 unnamed protein product [Spirodela intermedia]
MARSPPLAPSVHLLLKQNPRRLTAGAPPPSGDHQLLEENLSRDVVSATAVLSSLGREDRHGDAMLLFCRLLRLGLRPNQFTFGTTIHTATALRRADLGRQLHALATKMGLQCDVFVGSSLLDLYGKLGAVEEALEAFSAIANPNVVAHTALLAAFLKHRRLSAARRLFLGMPERNATSWNAMIGGCSKMGLNEESLLLFVEMCREGTRPNQSTFPSVLSTAGNAAHLGDPADVFVGNALISFYSKCGSPEDALLVFRRLRRRNLVTWNAILCGHAQNGRGREALALYNTMREEEGYEPNEVTLLGVLSACSHAGLVDDGTPQMLRPEHYACMVDMLARHGRVAEAHRFMAEETPFRPGIGFWKAALGGRLELGPPPDAASWVLLSNVYSAAGSWRRAAAVRQEMKERGVKRSPGCSWIEVGGRVQVFFNGDRAHPLAEEIYAVLDLCLSSSII